MTESTGLSKCRSARLQIGALPTWPYSRGWGYDPTGGVGLIVLILY